MSSTYIKTVHEIFVDHEKLNTLDAPRLSIAKVSITSSHA
jgi:hypothetical protein